MRVVLDTNVLSSAVLAKSGNPVQIIKMWQAGLFDLLLSAATYIEKDRLAGRLEKEVKVLAAS